MNYDQIVDNTRWMRKPRSYAGLEALLEEQDRAYRRDLWADADTCVEVWCEKDALAGVVCPITYKYDVPLVVARGYSSITFLHSAGSYINEIGVPARIYYLGDYDPSGVVAARQIEEGLHAKAIRCASSAP